MDNNQKVKTSPYYLGMTSEEQVQEALEAIEWIQSAGKTRRELMYADKIEKDYADEEVSIWFLGAVFNQIGNEEGEVLINDLPTLFVDEFELEDQEWLHPEVYLSMGKAISIIATIDYVSPADDWSPDVSAGERIAMAVSTRNPKLLSILSKDPCMVVRTIVALNTFTSPEVKLELRNDTFFDVRRRTFYDDDEAIDKFDAERDAINAGKIEAPDDDEWPGHCVCRIG
jgi:hypothetical protein